MRYLNNNLRPEGNHQGGIILNSVLRKYFQIKLLYTLKVLGVRMPYDQMQRMKISILGITKHRKIYTPNLIVMLHFHKNLQESLYTMMGAKMGKSF